MENNTQNNNRVSRLASRLRDLGEALEMGVGMKQPVISQLNNYPVLIKKIVVLFIVSTLAFSGRLMAQDTKVKTITETFERASRKGLYPIGKVNTPLGTWTFDDALVTPSEPLDFRPMAPRILTASTLDEPAGSVTTDFDIPGLKSVKVGFVGYKKDPGYFQVEVLISKDKGKTWESLGTSRGRYDKAAETFATFKVNSDSDKKQSYRVRIANASAPLLSRYNRNNLTLVEMEYGK